MVESEISIESHGAILSGTLCLPQADREFPTVLMIHGSGPLDRDENIKGQKLDVFNAIAKALAEAGIASIRYDKRGCGESTGNYFAATQLDLVNDAKSWVEVLLAKDFCKHNGVYLLGHSEGTVVGPRVYADQEGIAGLILLCPFVADIEETLLKQARQLDSEFAQFRGMSGLLHKALFAIFGNCISQQKKLIQKIKASAGDTIRFRFQKVPAVWYRELFTLDLFSIYRKIRCPTLIVGGEKDLQCDPNDVAAIESLCGGPVESHLLPNLTHVLRFDEGEPAITKSSELLESPVAEEVLDIIVSWITRKETLTT